MSVLDTTIVAPEQPSTTVIDLVAELTEEDPATLEPLYYSIDPDALDSIFGPTESGATRQGGVDFSYEGCDVTVRVDGEEVLVSVTTREVPDAPVSERGESSL